jgi:Flp pilus assembly protein TadD
MIDKSSVGAMVGLGKVALSERQYEVAVSQFSRALAIQPQASGIHYQLAMAYRGLHDISHAQDQIAKQGPKEPESPDPLIDGLEELKRGEGALWIRGTRAMNTGRISEAVEDFRQMVATSPKDPTARMYLGMALIRAGDQKGAVEEYLKALEIAPRNPGVHYNFGLVLAEAGSEQQAIDHFRAAVGADPQLTKAHFQLANLLMRRRDYRGALPEYATVISMEPRNGFARLMEAMALVRLNRYSEAKNKLEQALTVTPEDPDLMGALARVLASSPDRSVRDGPRALQLIEHVVQNRKSFDFDQGQTLAMALAAVGQFQRAAQLQGSMIAELDRARRMDLAELLRPNMALYEHGKPCLMPWRDDDPIFSPVPGKLENPEELQPVATSGRDKVNH